MGTMDLADLVNYYWLEERVLTVADECARPATARRKCKGERRREVRGAVSAGRSDSDLNL